MFLPCTGFHRISVVNIVRTSQKSFIAMTLSGIRVMSFRNGS
jgi:hypothetical protein